MSKKARYNPNIPQPERVLGSFRIGESIPLKQCWLKVAAVETGVLVLALSGYTKAGQEALERLKLQFQDPSLGQLAHEEGELV